VKLVRDALRRFEPIQSSFKRARFDELIQEAQDQLDRGEEIELTDESWERIKSNGERMASENRPIPWHISGLNPE
jgi:hypothetical protein